MSPFFLLVWLSQSNVKIRSATNSFQMTKELINRLMTTCTNCNNSLA